MIELRTLSRSSVEGEGALLAHRVRSLEDPVLPRGEPAEDLRLQRLRPGEAEVGLHTGERVRRDRRALLQGYADLVVPVQGVGREGGESGGQRLRGRERTRMGEDLLHPCGLTQQ